MGILLDLFMNLKVEKELLFFNEIGLVETVADGIVTIHGAIVLGLDSEIKPVNTYFVKMF